MFFPASSPVSMTEAHKTRRSIESGFEPRQKYFLMPAFLSGTQEESHVG
jgi:hypothetical protein